MRIEIRQTSASGSEASIRDHKVCIDRPAAKGGADSGPMGGELFLAAVGGCFMSTLLAAIRARGAEISNVRLEVTGSLGENPARFVGIELGVTGEGRHVALLPNLVEIAERGCVMMNTLRGTLELKIRQ